jgi:hypothetical protein
LAAQEWAAQDGLPKGRTGNAARSASFGAARPGNLGYSLPRNAERGTHGVLPAVSRFQHGEVAKRLTAAVLKTARVKALVGSNPTLSATSCPDTRVRDGTRTRGPGRCRWIGQVDPIEKREGRREKEEERRRRRPPVIDSPWGNGYGVGNPPVKSYVPPPRRGGRVAEGAPLLRV